MFRFGMIITGLWALASVGCYSNGGLGAAPPDKTTLQQAVDSKLDDSGKSESFRVFWPEGSEESSAQKAFVAAGPAIHFFVRDQTAGWKLAGSHQVVESFAGESRDDPIRPRWIVLSPEGNGGFVYSDNDQDQFTWSIFRCDESTIGGGTLRLSQSDSEQMKTQIVQKYCDEAPQDAKTHRLRIDQAWKYLKIEVLPAGADVADGPSGN